MPDFFRFLPLQPVRLPLAKKWPLYTGIFLAIGLSLYLYAGTLTLPFFQEDSMHIRWLSWHNPIEPFFTAVGAPDYRPLGKSILKFWYLVLGHHDPVWLRWHNIVFNILNIVLIGKLMSWLNTSRQRYVAGGLAALLFGALPFAYQAIPWINNFFYPLVNLLLLSMTAVYWQARLRHSRRLLVLALFLCALAPFEIEYGLMASSLLFTVELVLCLQKRQKAPWLTGVLIGLGLNIAFLARSLTIPKDPYYFGPPTWHRTLLIATYFLQGLMYPISPLAVPLMARTTLSDVSAIALVCLPLLACMAGFLAYRRQWGILLASLFWFGLLNLPAIVFADFNYVSNSPRLLYPAGVGIVWLWSSFLTAVFFEPAYQRLKLTLVTLFTLFVLWQNVNFVQIVLRHYQLAKQPIAQLTALARTIPTEDHLLVVNFPSWISPQKATFAMGNFGVQIIPFYIDIQELIYAHNDADHPTQAIQFTNIRQEQPYYSGLLGTSTNYDTLPQYLSDNGDVYVAQWSEKEIALAHAGRVSQVDLGATVAQFADQLTLAVPATAVSDNTLHLTLHWQVRQVINRDLTVFVHLYGPDGQLVAQTDGYPLLGLSPFWLWPAGQTLADERVLPWPADAPVGTYRAAVGVYDQADGQRLTAVNPAGEAIPDNAVIVWTGSR